MRRDRRWEKRETSWLLSENDRASQSLCRIKVSHGCMEFFHGSGLFTRGKIRCFSIKPGMQSENAVPRRSRLHSRARAYRPKVNALQRDCLLQKRQPGSFVSGPVL